MGSTWGMSRVNLTSKHTHLQNDQGSGCSELSGGCRSGGSCPQERPDLQPVHRQQHRIDEFLTSETTENEIVAFVEQLCSALGQIIDGFEATCKFLVESQLPAIIEGLVNDNLKPDQICTDLLGACP